MPDPWSKYTWGELMCVVPRLYGTGWTWPNVTELLKRIAVLAVVLAITIAVAGVLIQEIGFQEGKQRITTGMMVLLSIIVVIGGFAVYAFLCEYVSEAWARIDPPELTVEEMGAFQLYTRLREKFADKFSDDDVYDRIRKAANESLDSVWSLLRCWEEEFDSKQSDQEPSKP
jgi:hypothetical protein